MFRATRRKRSRLPPLTAGCGLGSGCCPLPEIQPLYTRPHEERVRDGAEPANRLSQAPVPVKKCRLSIFAHPPESFFKADKYHLFTPVMPSLRRLLPLLIAVSIPLLGAAQTSPSNEHHCPLYVGLGALVGSYQLPDGSSTNVVSPVPTVGVQVLPRLALQASAAYYQKTFAVSEGTFYVTHGQVRYQRVDGHDRRRTVPVLLLARYTLTPRPANRLQAEVLAGVTLLRSSLHQQRSTVDSTGVATSTADDLPATTGTYFNLGAGARYRVLPRLDVMTDWVFNRLIIAHPGGPLRLSATLSVGLRYRFDR